jgi:glutaredoxin-related protein
MKGSPDNPKDGYQAELIEALRDNHVKFGYCDVLKDHELRQNIKEYTGCNSYPQVYINQKFIGGLSKILEIIESNKLVSIVPTSEIIQDSDTKVKNLLQQKEFVLFVQSNIFTK